MSSDQIISNPIILEEIATGIQPYFPGTGITSITNTDHNLDISINGRTATINFDNNITIDNLNVTGTADFSNFNNPWPTHQPSVNGQILSSTTGGALSWVNNVAGTLSFIGSYQGQGPEPSVENQTITVFDQNIGGLTAGKTLIGQIGFSTNISNSVAGPYPLVIQIYVDNNLYTTVQTGISGLAGGFGNTYQTFFQDVNFNRVNTASSHNIKMTATIQSEGLYVLSWDQYTYYTSLFLQT